MPQHRAVYAGVVLLYCRGGACSSRGSMRWDSALRGFCTHSEYQSVREKRFSFLGRVPHPSRSRQRGMCRHNSPSGLPLWVILRRRDLLRKSGRTRSLCGGGRGLRGCWYTCCRGRCPRRPVFSGIGIPYPLFSQGGERSEATSASEMLPCYTEVFRCLCHTTNTVLVV